MGIKQLVISMICTLKMARKPNADEFKLYLRLVLLSTAVIGIIGFAIQLVGSLLNLGGS